MWRSGRATPSIATRALAASCDGHRGTARGGQTMRKIGWLILGLAGVLSAPVRAACEDSVVLVHGNTGTPSQFDNTYVELRARGYTDAQIFRPSWGRSEEHTSELQSLMRISYAVLRLKKNTT